MAVDQGSVPQWAGRVNLPVEFPAIIVESLSDGFVTIDHEGVIKYMNGAAGRILGIDPRKAVGSPLAAVVKNRPVVLDVLRTGVGWTDREFFVETKSRGMVHLLKTAVPIFDEGRRVTGVIETFKEIKRFHDLVNHLVGAQARFGFDDIIGQNRAFLQSVELARIAAQSNSNVIIQGESGTGKELFAQAIHRASNRSAGPLVAINCAAIPRDLLESELFGYVDGAFTGAAKGGRPGKFELAGGGTLLLDEIGDMPIDMQVKLLRVLQNREVVRVGDHHVIPVDVRVVAMTNRDLFKEVRRGAFREDLFYRLNVLSITIPPLRDRKDDIPMLVSCFLKKLNRSLGKAIDGVSPETLRTLANYSWPGNVRELENRLERAVNIADGTILSVRDIDLTREYPGPCRGPAPDIPLPSEHEPLREEVLNLDEMERIMIIRALGRFGGNISRVADALGVGRNTLYSKILRYGIDRRMFDN